MKMNNYPFDAEEMLKKSRRMKRDLLADGTKRIHKKIAVLGGSTTHDIIRMMELFLLQQGIEPEFYESEYAQYFEDAMFGNEKLDAFAPDVIYIYTTFRNLRELPEMSMDRAAVKTLEDETYAKFEQMWKHLQEKFHCVIIQNNFEYPAFRLQGNRDASDYRGRVRFAARLNERFADYADTHENFFLHDLNYLSAQFGLDEWLDDAYWNLYKYALSMKAIPVLAFSVTNIIKSLYGKNKKALVLDLDNTLWGGVIGDDGVDGIELGEETAVGETYREFQSYLKEQKSIGVLLAVDSKNDEANALAGLNHPESVLKPEDFVDIRANWDPKSVNFTAIAKDLNIGEDSMVFVDDNPAEREIIRQQVPGAAVPEITENEASSGDTPSVSGPENYIRVLDRAGYFEVTSFSSEDARKSEMYRENAERRKAQASFADYGEYLKSLFMKAQIRPFEPVHYARIAQLTNKSNQFNLTTKRCTEADIETFAEDPETVTLYGRLEDKFGDNGIVSLIIGSEAMTLRDDEETLSRNGGRPAPAGEKALLIDLWLMSCRVLKRGMENAMMDALVSECSRRHIGCIFGYYYPTAKNAMVKDFYDTMGFTKVSEDASGNTVWKFQIPRVYTNKNRYIRVNA